MKGGLALGPIDHAATTWLYTNRNRVPNVASSMVRRSCGPYGNIHTRCRVKNVCFIHGAEWY